MAHDQNGLPTSVLVPPGFSASATFVGARPDFVFKRGIAGLGYYPDEAPRITQPMPDDVATLVRRRCHYEVLGLRRDAPDDAIRRAYHRMALELHPDRSVIGAEAATERFQEVQAAYAVLSDAQERRWYDTHREAILSGGSEAAIGQSEHIAPHDEPPELHLWSYFSRSAFDHFEAGQRDFYAVYTRVFAAVDAEERETRLIARVAPTVAGGAAPVDSSRAGRPGFGDQSTCWDEVAAFYSSWERFETCRTYAGEDRHDSTQLERANKQRRKAMERENARLRADAKRKRDVRFERAISPCMYRPYAHGRR